MDTYDFNTGMHVVYDAQTAGRSAHRCGAPATAACFIARKLFFMGGEGTTRVFGQPGAYDPQTDS
jgi:hypothetical protein